MFRSFFLGGFECSTHRRRCGRRLDMVAATGHDRFAAADYARLKDRGVLTVREGLRWHLIEATPGRFDFSSVLPILHAASSAGVQVIWDLFHYGLPDDLDIFGPDFVRRFARMAHAFAGLLDGETDGTPWVAPVNEISFVSWAGGEVGQLDPYALARGLELKKQLVRASIEATEAVWAAVPSARVAQIDPVFHAVAHPDRPHEASAAEAYSLAKFQAWDMLCGRLSPELGGHPKYLDVIGVNYYPWNQWYYTGPTSDGPTIGPENPLYRPFRRILEEVAGRYGRPLFVAETGTEGDARAGWLRYVGHETRAAMLRGVPVAGVCLYPVVNFPGWENDRDCQNGLWGHPDDQGDRAIHEPLARELARQIRKTERLALARRRHPRRSC